jgi:hypothetical protein
MLHIFYPFARFLKAHDVLTLQTVPLMDVGATWTNVTYIVAW